MAITTIWEQMESLLDEHGFRQYRVDDLSLTDSDPERDDKESAVESGQHGPMTILELVRGSLGVRRHAADFPVYMFWRGNAMRELLDHVWGALNEALRQEYPNAREIISWCYLPIQREVDDLRKIVRQAARNTPDLPSKQFVLRPRSSQMVGAESSASAAINLMGIVCTMQDLSYGDVVSSVIGESVDDLALIVALESRLSEDQRRDARCDTATPIPQLMSRLYFYAAKLAASQSERLSLSKYLLALEENNNLAGMSDAALCKRLVQSMPTEPGVSVARMPQNLQRKLEKYLLGA